MNQVVEIHAEVIERARRGERDAFSRLYKLYSAAMFNIALRITNDRMVAEDVLQEAFFEAFTSLKSFRQESTFGAWLKRIVIFRSIDVNRKNGVWEFVDEVPDMQAEEENLFGDKEEETRQQIERVRRAMELLPHGSRTVLSLYLFEGYDHEEISEILKISVSTSKTQYMRAKQKLLQILQEEKSYG